MHKHTLFTTVLLASILAGSRGGYVEHLSPSGSSPNYHQPRTMMNNGYPTSEVNKQSSGSPISPASFMAKRSGNEPDHSSTDAPTSIYSQAPGQHRETSACQAPIGTPLYDHTASSNAPFDHNDNANESQPYSSQAPASAPPSPTVANTSRNAHNGNNMLAGVPYYGRSSNSSSHSPNVLSPPQLQPGSSKNSGGQAPSNMTAPSTSQDGSHTRSSSSPSPNFGSIVPGQSNNSSSPAASGADDDSSFRTPFYDQSAGSHGPSNHSNNAAASQRHSSQAPAIVTPSPAIAKASHSADSGMDMLAGTPPGRASKSSLLSSNALSPSQPKPASSKSSAGEAPSSMTGPSTSQDGSHPESSTSHPSQPGMGHAPGKSTSSRSPTASDSDDDSSSYIQSIPMEADDVPSDSPQQDSSSSSGGPSQPPTEGERSNPSDRSASPAASQEAPSGSRDVTMSKSSLVPSGFSLKLLHNSSTEVSGSTAHGSEPNSGPTLNSGTSELPAVAPTIDGTQLPSNPVSTLLRRDALALPKPRLSRPKCPRSMRACPTRTSGMMQFPRGDKWECLDFDELVSCGGCTTEGTGRDCTQIPGIDGTACENDHCKILTCLDSHVMKDGHCVAK